MMHLKIMKLLTTFIALAALLITVSVSAGRHKDRAANLEPQWYLRLTVVAPDEDNIRDRGNVLGQLDDSRKGYDLHDLMELNPFSSPYLTLVFEHDDWAEPGNYSSDFHATGDLDQNKKKKKKKNSDNRAITPVRGNLDQWSFQVHSDDSYRNITLYWDQPRLVARKVDANADESERLEDPRRVTAQDLFERMWLEDTQTGDRIYAVSSGYPQSYEFNMDGRNVRSFRWVLEDRFGRSPKAEKTKRHRPDETLQPGSSQSGSDPIDGPPPAVGR